MCRKNPFMWYIVCLLSCAALLVGCTDQELPDPSSPASKEEGLSSVTISSLPEELQGRLAGKTILDVANSQNGTFILTGEHKVLYYGAYDERLKECAVITREYTAQESDLFVLTLPEPIESIAPYAAVGESGAVYFFLQPKTDAWVYFYDDVNLPAVTKAEVGEEIRQVRYGRGDFVLVAESGKVYTVGELTLYGNGLGKADKENLMKPMQAVVPEEITEAAVSEYQIFLLGKSGKVYMAYRYMLLYGEKIPEDVANSLPYPYTKQLFQPTEFQSVKQILCGTAGVYDESNAVYLLQEDGSVWYWQADKETRLAFNPPLQSEKAEKPTFPTVRFQKMDFGNQNVEKIWGEPNLGNTYFLTNQNYCYVSAGAKGASEDLLPPRKVNEIPQVEEILPIKGGFLAHGLDKKLYYYGEDRARLIRNQNKDTLQEVTWLQWLSDTEK